jgi:hypothetical protein
LICEKKNDIWIIRREVVPVRRERDEINLGWILVMYDNVWGYLHIRKDNITNIISIGILNIFIQFTINFFYFHNID